MIKLHRHPKGEQLLCTFLTIPHNAHFTRSLLMSLGHLVAVCVRETLGKSCIYTYCRPPCINPVINPVPTNNGAKSQKIKVGWTISYKSVSQGCRTGLL